MPSEHLVASHFESIIFSFGQLTDRFQKAFCFASKKTTSIKQLFRKLSVNMKIQHTDRRMHYLLSSIKDSELPNGDIIPGEFAPSVIDDLSWVLLRLRAVKVHLRLPKVNSLTDFAVYLTRVSCYFMIKRQFCEAYRTLVFAQLIQAKAKVEAKGNSNILHDIGQYLAHQEDYLLRTCDAINSPQLKFEISIGKKIHNDFS